MCIFCYMLSFLVIEKIVHNFCKISQNLFGISRKFRETNKEFCKNFAKINDFIFAKFRNKKISKISRNNLVKILCFANFLKCCFAATLLCGHVLKYSLTTRAHAERVVHYVGTISAQSLTTQTPSRRVVDQADTAGKKGIWVSSHTQQQKNS